jgi:hypothetical protein
MWLINPSYLNYLTLIYLLQSLGTVCVQTRSKDKCYNIVKLNIWSLQKFWVDLSNHGTFWEIRDGRQDGHQCIEKWLIHIFFTEISFFRIYLSIDYVKLYILLEQYENGAFSIIYRHALDFIDLFCLKNRHRVDIFSYKSRHSGENEYFYHIFQRPGQHLSHYTLIFIFFV